MSGSKKMSAFTIVTDIDDEAYIIMVDTSSDPATNVRILKSDFLTAVVSAIGGGYKKFVALMTQTGSEAPVVTSELENSIGAIVWTRVGEGTYNGTLAGAFPEGKTWGVGGYITDSHSGWGAFISRQDDNTIVLTGLNDDQLLSTPIEIRVYP